MKRTHEVKITMSETSGTIINLYDYIGEDKANQLFYKKGDKYYGVVILSKKYLPKYKKVEMFYSREHVKRAAKQYAIDLLDKHKRSLAESSITIFFNGGTTKQFKNLVRLDNMSDKVLSFYYKNSKGVIKKVGMSRPKFECDTALQQGSISSKLFWDCPFQRATYSEMYGCLSFDSEPVLRYYDEKDGSYGIEMKFSKDDKTKLKVD